MAVVFSHSTGAAARAAALSMAIVCCSLACSSPVTPEREASVRPELRFLEVQNGRMRDGGILFVEMAQVDTGYRLPTNEYLPVTVTSPAGESEALRLRREICGLETGNAYICHFFSVSVAQGHDVRDIEGDLQRFNARLTLVAAIPTFGSAYAFGDWGRTMADVRKLRNVVNVDYVRLLISTADFPPFATLLAGAAPFNYGIPTPGDGVVTAHASDTLSITYIQPDGSPLTYRVSPPPESQGQAVRIPSGGLIR